MRKLVLLLAVMSWTVAGVGQSNYGVINGAVSDAQHLGVAGAVMEKFTPKPGRFSVVEVTPLLGEKPKPTQRLFPESVPIPPR